MIEHRLIGAGVRAPRDHRIQYVRRLVVAFCERERKQQIECITRGRIAEDQGAFAVNDQAIALLHPIFKILQLRGEFFKVIEPL